MRIDSVDELKAAFEAWRSRKRYAREPVPGALMDRARRAAGVHGLGPVARAVKVEHHRLRGGHGVPVGQRKGPGAAVPSFSRVELTVPPTLSRPFAEVETPTGLKLRLFAQTQETLGLLSALCGVGGGR